MSMPLHELACPHAVCGMWKKHSLLSEKRSKFHIHFLFVFPAMASADLGDELSCSICLSIYTDPVTLPCGHSFCTTCIGRVLDTQDRARVYTCPECRAEFQERPALEKNRKLRNIAERFRSANPEQEKTGIRCTHCLQSPVLAVKTCLHCEASLCENHLRIHSKSPEHVLTEPTASLENRRCSVHKEILRYYCCEDTVCICVSCSLAGKHKGHQVETLSEAAEKKKETMINILQKMSSKREKAEKRVQSLEELKRKVQEKAAGVTKDVTALIKDIRKRLEILEQRVLSEISRQEAQVSRRVSDLIRQLEIKKEELSKKMVDIEELFDMKDPLTVLQEWKSYRAANYCDAEEDTERCDIKVHDAGDLDVGLISVTLHSGLAGIVTGVKRQRRVPAASDMSLDVNTASDMLLDVNTAADMLLDVNTAGNYISLSGDLKTVSWPDINRNRPEKTDRFECGQVLSSRGFSSGRHYWEAEGSETGWWEVGMTYPSIERKGALQCIGENNKSWCLWRNNNNQYSVRHDRKLIQLPHPPSCRRFGMFLDYEAGRLSFYELCDPIRHLQTFNATFTEPLHAAFCVFRDNAWVRI
uniref:Uncharacterized protein n=1 Tax=Leptobrachium leishanense TaxID=445787 RepID=A0A8C5MHF8_9ANUR